MALVPGFGGGLMDPFALLGAPFGRGGRDLFDIALPSVDQLMPSTGHPLDIIECKENYLVRCDVPGMTADDITIQLHEGVLTISGKKKHATESRDEAGRVLRSERRFTQFSRSLTVPDSVKEDNVTAALANGVLEVTIPKAEPARAAPKRIAVQAAGGAGSGAAGAPKVTHAPHEAVEAAGGAAEQEPGVHEPMKA